MNKFQEYILQNIYNGRISEIIDITEKFFHQKASDLPPEIKADVLCFVMCITRDDLDEVIATHSEVSRTIKGHAFEVVFDSMMAINGIPCIEIGGDMDIDRIINKYTLQLKTPYVNGCSENLVSYKTHKTHGSKSQIQSIDYYHKVEDFADYLIGLVSYEPFRVLIVPKESLPRVDGYPEYIQSPMYLIIAIEPPYSNILSIHTFDKYDYFWNFYCISMSQLRKHPTYTNRVFSHQHILYKELQKYRIDSSWIGIWAAEL